MAHTLPQQVLAHADQAAMVELASALIRMPSFTTEETPVAQFLADFFRPPGAGTFACCEALKNTDSWQRRMGYRASPGHASAGSTFLRGAWPRGTRKASWVWGY